jgi:hypothetical protein
MRAMLTGPTPSEQATALLLFARALDAIGVPYMVTGSMAAAFYVAGRATADIDVVIDAGSDMLPYLRKVLVEDFEADADVINEAIGRRTMFNILSKDALAKIDVIVRKQGGFDDDAFVRRRLIDFMGESIAVIAPEDLVIAKLDWARIGGSDRQLADVHAILRMSDLDVAYVEQQAARFALTTLLEKARDERYGR